MARSAHHRPWWWVPALWLDPVRGYAGAWLLKGALPLTDNQWASVDRWAYGVLIAVLIVGVVAQLFTRRDEGVLLAPLGFVAGVMIALTPWMVVGMGLIAAFTCLFAFRQFQGFFFGGLVGVAALGFLLGEFVIWIVPALVVLSVPLVAGLVTGSSLELPIRDNSGPMKRVPVVAE